MCAFVLSPRHLIELEYVNYHFVLHPTNGLVSAGFHSLYFEFSALRLALYVLDVGKSHFI